MKYPPTKQTKEVDWESKERRDATDRKTTSLIIQFCKTLDDVKNYREQIIETAKDYVDSIWETYPDRETDLPTIQEGEEQKPL